MANFCVESDAAVEQLYDELWHAPGPSIASSVRSSPT